MPKNIDLPDRPAQQDLKTTTKWLFEYELKKAAKESGMQLKDLPDVTPLSRDRIARLFWGNSKHGIEKALYKPSELTFFSALMDWGRPASSLNRMFNHVFVTTGKPKTEYEKDLEARLDKLITYMRGQIPRMIHEEAVKLQELIATIEVKGDEHDYPDVEFAGEAVKP